MCVVARVAALASAATVGVLGAVRIAVVAVLDADDELRTVIAKIGGVDQAAFNLLGVCLQSFFLVYERQVEKEASTLEDLLRRLSRRMSVAVGIKSWRSGKSTRPMNREWSRDESVITHRFLPFL